MYESTFYSSTHPTLEWKRAEIPLPADQTTPRGNTMKEHLILYLPTLSIVGSISLYKIESYTILQGKLISFVIFLIVGTAMYCRIHDVGKCPGEKIRRDVNIGTSCHFTPIMILWHSLCISDLIRIVQSGGGIRFQRYTVCTHDQRWKELQVISVGEEFHTHSTRTNVQ